MSVISVLGRTPMTLIESVILVTFLCSALSAYTGESPRSREQTPMDRTSPKENARLATVEDFDSLARSLQLSLTDSLPSQLYDLVHTPQGNDSNPCILERMAYAALLCGRRREATDLYVKLLKMQASRPANAGEHQKTNPAEMIERIAVNAKLDSLFFGQAGNYLLIEDIGGGSRVGRWRHKSYFKLSGAREATYSISLQGETSPDTVSFLMENDSAKSFVREVSKCSIPVLVNPFKDASYKFDFGNVNETEPPLLRVILQLGGKTYRAQVMNPILYPLPLAARDSLQPFVQLSKLCGLVFRSSMMWVKAKGTYGDIVTSVHGQNNIVYLARQGCFARFSTLRSKPSWKTPRQSACGLLCCRNEGETFFHLGDSLVAVCDANGRTSYVLRVPCAEKLYFDADLHRLYVGDISAGSDTITEYDRSDGRKVRVVNLADRGAVRVKSGKALGSADTVGSREELLWLRRAHR